MLRRVQTRDSASILRLNTLMKLTASSWNPLNLMVGCCERVACSCCYSYASFYFASLRELAVSLINVRSIYLLLGFYAVNPFCAVSLTSTVPTAQSPFVCLQTRTLCMYTALFRGTWIFPPFWLSSATDLDVTCLYRLFRLISECESRN